MVDLYRDRGLEVYERAHYSRQEHVAEVSAALAGLVLVLGLAMAIANLLAEPPAERTPEEVARMTVAERAESSREPLWLSFSMPFLAALGVILGGRSRRRQDDGLSQD